MEAPEERQWVPVGQGLMDQAASFLRLWGWRAFFYEEWYSPISTTYTHLFWGLAQNNFFSERNFGHFAFHSRHIFVIILWPPLLLRTLASVRNRPVGNGRVLYQRSTWSVVFLGPSEVWIQIGGRRWGLLPWTRLGQWVREEGTDPREPLGQYIWGTPEPTLAPLAQPNLDRLDWRREGSLELESHQPLPSYITLGQLPPRFFISKTEIIIPPHRGILRVQWEV